MKFKLSTFALFVAFAASPLARAHKGHHHEHEELPKGKAAETSKAASLKIIANEYAQRIEPIFKNKCMNCHSTHTRFPWYYEIPGIKQMIDSDISEAREHLDFTAGFPFTSHASPTEDLTAIRDSIRDNSMPPLSYRLLHPMSILTEKEKEIILRWVDQSKMTIEK